MTDLGKPGLTAKLRVPHVLFIASGPRRNVGPARTNKTVSSILFGQTEADSRANPKRVASTIELPFRTESFIVVQAYGLLDLLDATRTLSLLRECRRVLHRDGMLHLAVPREGFDPAAPDGGRAKSFNALPHPFPASTSPRPLNYSALERLLDVAGFPQVGLRASEDTLAVPREHTGSLRLSSRLVAAHGARAPHEHQVPLPDSDYHALCHTHVRTWRTLPSATFVIPVRNEAKGLPTFCVSLKSAQNETRTRREFIFVLNGCTDASGSIANDFAQHGLPNCKVVSSDIGIVTALRKGIAERTLEGFVGKLDADTVLHPHALDLMQIHLARHPNVKVTYADPVPIDSPSPYSEPEHHPGIASRQLYLNGKASLYREDPFSEPAFRAVAHYLRVEDIFLSFYYTYFYGLDAIATAPNALVYHHTIRTFQDLVNMVSRSNSEIHRVCQLYPPFRAIKPVFEQTISPGQYQSLLHRAKTHSAYVNDWTRLITTK